MKSRINRQFFLASRPVGLPTAEDIPMRDVPVEAPKPGEVLVRNLYLSLDPAIRDWMSESKSYLPPMPIGAPVWGITVGKVVESTSPRFTPGDLVQGLNAWEQYSCSRADMLNAIDTSPGIHPRSYLGVLGPAGMTAYFGLYDVGKPQAGETVLVSAAAGAVGSLVGQLAKLKGCRVVGIAGGADKCRWLTETLGFDRAIDYKACEDIEQAIAEACPEGVDIYFDNVGGKILDGALMNINERARVVFCGAISTYNNSQPAPGPYNMWQLLAKSARIEGFVVSNYAARFPEAIAAMTDLILSDKLQFKEQVVEGIEQTLSAFLTLFDGSNTGKLIVDLTGSN